MILRPTLSLGLLLAAISLAVPSFASACTVPALTARHQQPINISRPDNRLFNEAVLHYINLERCKNGRQPFKSDSRLVGMAAGHSNGMARTRTFAHRIPRAGYETMVKRLDRAGVNFKAAAENIARDYVYVIASRPISTKTAGRCQFFYSGSGEPVPKHSYQSLARDAVNLWMGSAGHRRNILDRRFTRTGAAFGVNPNGSACGEVYLTQNFAN
jgi:uncharacterized protein YkwD